ncbi:MAG TPA: DNA polymerase III subunit alpha [Actinomycetota bacterium]|nr:DNA polymerase III subunit alpha [Actinomycetota bacterium]
MSDSFVHIHTHTEYSMLDGASRIEELMRAAAEHQMPAIAITDHGVMYGAVDFYQAAQRHGVKPIIGTELYVATRSRFDKSSKEKDSNHHMTAVAESDEGYHNLVKLVSLAHLEGYYYRPRVDKDLLAQYATGIIATTGCLAGEVGQLLLQGQVEQATRVAGEYREIFGRDNFFVELQDHGLGDQHTVFPRLLEIAKAIDAPLLATNDLHYVRQSDASAHDALLCIQTGSTINEPGRFKFDAEEFYLKSPAEMRALFAQHPDACDNSLAIAERCNTQLEFGVQRLPKFQTPTGEPVESYLRTLTYKGAGERYGDPLPAEVKERIEYELETIISMGFASYFLIVADLIEFAKSRGVRCGPGRGSAAGSIVSYCLGIVNMDPIKYRLMFERFLNPARREMPDIDMDFDVRGRGEVLQYAVRKYGEDHVAQIVTFATIKGKQAIRDAARVLGMPYVVGDRLARAYPPGILGKDPPLIACFDKTFEWPPGEGTNQAYSGATDLRTAYETDEDSRKVIDVARGLEGLRRQAGVHAAGVVISDVPLTDVVPVWRNEAIGGGIVTQYEMNAVAHLGLLKMDFLGLRNLTILGDAIDQLRRRGVDIDIDRIPMDDPKTFAMLSRGETTGVFQLEGPAMRDYLVKLKPDHFEDIIAMNALYRPGPMKEIPKYIKGKNDPTSVQYLHPALEPILKDTYGVIVYQEQILQLLQLIAGYSASEADLVRKAIGKKIREKMDAEEPRFIEGAQRQGLSKEQARTLWRLIEPFAGYSFNRAHAACYGLVAYQTAYLRANYPVEYMAALLTSVKDNPDRSPLYLADARALKITVEPPDVNASDMDFTPTERGTIRYGLSAVRNVGENVVAKIKEARQDKGEFTSFEDFVGKVNPVVLNRRVIESLAKAGAFDSLGVERSQLLQRDAEKGLVLSDAAAARADAANADARAREQGQFSLFAGHDDMGSAHMHTPLPAPAEQLPKNQLLAAEKEMLGVYVSDHPLFAVEEVLKQSASHKITDLHSLREQDPVTVAGMVTRLQKKFTKKGEPMAVFWLEDLQGTVEVLVFPSSYVSAAPMLTADAIVTVRGKIDTRDDEPKVVAQEVAVPTLDAGGAPLVLSVPAETCTPAFVERLKTVLESHPGPTPVHLRLLSGATPAKTIRLPHRYCVERRNGLYAELKVLLGQKALD